MESETIPKGTTTNIPLKVKDAPEELQPDLYLWLVIKVISYLTTNNIVVRVSWNSELKRSLFSTLSSLSLLQDKKLI